MSELFYNRDQNISGVLELDTISFAPEYGSTVNFSHRSNSYETQNGYMNSMPMSANSLSAVFDLNFKLSQTETQQLVNYIESKRGVGIISFSDPSNFYKSLSGVCSSYSIDHMSRNMYNVAISLSIEEIPNLFNWSGMSFINNPIEPWSNGQEYQKYKTIYQTKNTNKLDNYFYCIENHSSNTSNQPTAASSKWTQEFFFEPDYEMKNSVNIAVAKSELKNSFIQNIATRKHLAALELNYSFDEISTEQAKSIMHFLENKGGYRRFIVRPNSIYNRPKVFYAPSWDHTWNFFDSHSISITLKEDPLGIIPKNS